MIQPFVPFATFKTQHPDRRHSSRLSIPSSDAAFTLSVSDGYLHFAPDNTPIGVIFVVSLSGPHEAIVPVFLQTRDGSAIAALGDYDSLEAELIFLPGQTQQEVYVSLPSPVGKTPGFFFLDATWCRPRPNQISRPSGTGYAPGDPIFADTTQVTTDSTQYRGDQMSVYRFKFYPR
jgi:hypothetical protein